MTDAGRGQFHFDPATYLDMIRAEIPVYDEFQGAVADATGASAVERLLELGFGTGETTARVLNRHPAAAVVGVDGTPEMLPVAAARHPTADLRLGRLEDPLPEGRFDLVVSALAVHHLPGPAKADLFRRVAGVLEPGATFVLGDVIVSDDPADASIPLEPGVDLPDRIDDLLGWLADAGFASSVTWRLGDLAVIRAELTG